MNAAVIRYVQGNVWGLALALSVLVLSLFGVLDAEASVALAVGATADIATDTFDLENAMKIMFEDTLETNVVKESELLDLFETSADVQVEKTGGGRYIETAHLFGLPTGYGYRSSGEPVPVPRGPKIANARINLKKSMGSVSIDGDVFERVVQGREAFTSWAEQVFPSLMDHIKNEKDRILLGAGTGVRARVATIDAVNLVITVKDALGGAGYGNAVLQIHNNEDLAFATDETGATTRPNAAGGHHIVVEDVDYGTGEIRLSEIPTGLAVDDVIFGADAHGISSPNAGVNREFMGLLGHVDDGTNLLDYFNIPRDEYSAWKSTVVDISGAPYPGAAGVFNDEAIIYGDIQAGLRSGAKFDVLLVPYMGAYSFWKDLKEDRALNDPRTWTGGDGQLHVRVRDRVVQLRAVRKMPPQLAMGLTKGSFKRYTLGKFEWVKRTGSLWQPVIKDGKLYDAYRAFGVDHDEIFCRAPGQQVRFEGLA